jgi:hypothetical protein
MNRSLQNVVIIVGVTVAVVVAVALLNRAPPAPPPRVFTEAEKVAAATQRAESEANAARQLADFTAQRSIIVTKAKTLNAAGKYQEAADLGTLYAFAHDDELNAQLKIARDKLAAIAVAKVKAQKKKEGVSIGMSKEDVLASSWGKPDHINTTTNAYGTSEQWVYGRYHNGYLYFRDGILTSIQN